MKTALITHTDCLLHQGQRDYQEIPARLSVVLDALQDLDLTHIDAPLAAHDDLRRAHPQTHIDAMLHSVPAGELIEIDYDTALDRHTASAALRAVGAACRAVDGVIKGEFDTSFCAVRPPGHHAEPNRAMGFCYFSAIAIAALRAQQVHGISNIAIVDFDVHHGNGTQACVQDVEGIYFASLHQHPHYPNTGVEVPNTNIRNIPLPAGTSARAWRREFEDKVMADLNAFSPELVLVSAGFDAHKNDPLGAFNLTELDYHWMGQTLQNISNGNLVSVLEGGYNLTALAASARAYVCGTQGKDWTPTS
jgi:acetoin utilization deacetylase AcuC-like enzyme